MLLALIASCNAATPIPEGSPQYFDFRGSSDFHHPEFDKLFGCKTYDELRDQLKRTLKSFQPKEGQWASDATVVNAEVVCRLALIRTLYLLGDVKEADSLLLTLHGGNGTGRDPALPNQIPQAEQPGAAQPATQPAEDEPAQVQPLPQSSKDDSPAPISVLEKAVEEQAAEVEKCGRALEAILKAKGIVYRKSDDGQSEVVVDSSDVKGVQDYVNAKAQYLAAKEMLQQMKLKLISEKKESSMDQ